jgi:hypothetical protein
MAITPARQRVRKSRERQNSTQTQQTMNKRTLLNFFAFRLARPRIVAETSTRCLSNGEETE